MMSTAGTGPVFCYSCWVRGSNRVAIEYRMCLEMDEEEEEVWHAKEVITLDGVIGWWSVWSIGVGGLFTIYLSLSIHLVQINFLSQWAILFPSVTMSPINCRGPSSEAIRTVFLPTRRTLDGDFIRRYISTTKMMRFTFDTNFGGIFA